MRSEDDLVRMLRSASDQAKPLPGGLSGAVADRRRRRRVRQRAQMALAAAAVVVIAGGTAAALSNGGGQSGPATQATETSSAIPTTLPVQEPEAKHVSELWPQAMSKVPAKAADGWEYRLVAALSPTEILLAAEKSFEKTGRLEVYDTTAKAVRVLGTVPEPKRGYFAQDWVANEQYVGWYGETPNNKDVWADLWIMPRAGGEARQVKELTGDVAEIDEIGLTSEHFVWSVRKGGVYRIPLAGGEPERLPNSDGLHLSTWPWAVGYGPGDQAERNQNRLVNLETGQSTDIQAGDNVKYLACTLDKCLGSEDARSFVQRLDGSDKQYLPAPLSFFGQDDMIPNEFVSLMGKSAPMLYDLKTGQLARFGKESWKDGGSYGRNSDVISWDDDAEPVEECDESKICSAEEKGGGKEFTVLNLKAIPR